MALKERHFSRGHLSSEKIQLIVSNDALLQRDKFVASQVQTKIQNIHSRELLASNIYFVRYGKLVIV